MRIWEFCSDGYLLKLNFSWSGIEELTSLEFSCWFQELIFLLRIRLIRDQCLLRLFSKWPCQSVASTTMNTSMISELDIDSYRLEKLLHLFYLVLSIVNEFFSVSFQHKLKSVFLPLLFLHSFEELRYQQHTFYLWKILVIIL